MKIDIITIFPQFFTNFLDTSIIKRAQDKTLVELNVHNLRDYTKDKHKNVDDTPYGGGEGMLMQVEPFDLALEALKTKDSHIVLLSPQGELFSQEKAKILANKKHLILLCAHYEGVDDRIKHFINEEISIGDYILTGGEIPAMIISDAVIRLIPDVILEESHQNDSLENNLLKYPQYTKPREYKGYEVPEVLLSGNHQEIQKWREYMRIKTTALKRPDLLKKTKLDDEQQQILKKIENNK